MQPKSVRQIRAFFVWSAFVAAFIIPIFVAALSPQLQWRDPIYIVAGFAGVIAMSLLFIQPIMIGEYLSGLSARTYRKVHRLVGGVLVGAVLLHVIGLWITSPPDVIDALLFASPTQFSIWGVIAMWAVFISALLAMSRKRFRIKLRIWRIAHMALALTIVSGSVAHAMLIEGTMGIVSKTVICVFVVLATLSVIISRLGLPKKTGL